MEFMVYGQNAGSASYGVWDGVRLDWELPQIRALPLIRRLAVQVTNLSKESSAFLYKLHRLHYILKSKYAPGL